MTRGSGEGSTTGGMKQKQNPIAKYLRTKRFEAQGLCNVCGKRQPKSDKHKKCEECIDKRKLQEARRWQ